LMQPNGDTINIGSLQFSYNSCADEIISVINKEITTEGSQVKELFQVNFDRKLNIISMFSQGVLNGSEYEFSCKSQKGKFNLNFKTTGLEKKHTVNIKKNFYENNNFPFMLIPILQGKSSISAEVFVPLTADFVEVEANKINSAEMYLLDEKEISCERFKINVAGSMQASQYFLYCSKTGRLVKGIIGNQLIELDQIIR